MIYVAIAAIHQASSASTQAVVETLAIVVSTIIVSLAGWGTKKLVAGAKDMHRVLIILVGEKPDRFDQNPKKGIIETVDNHSAILEALVNASKASITDNQQVQGPASREAVRQLGDLQKNGEHHA